MSTSSADRPRVAIGALGGTIASTSADGTQVVPTLTAELLARAVPGLDRFAAIHAETLATLPSPSLDEAVLARAVAWASTQVAAGAAGVVITQGTDTLDEAAYLLDLWWDHPEPLVVTGAMRSPQGAGADGPANLLAAVQTAAAPQARSRGVLAVMADQIHLARRVAKSDSVSVAAFASPGWGPVGRVVEGVAEFAMPAEPSRPEPIRLPTPWSAPRVGLVATHLGDDGALLELVDPHRFAGVVVAGVGAGHVSAPMAEVVGGLAAQIPVVFATRTGSGPTGKAIYGYPGSEIDLMARGAIRAGWLAPIKARLLLTALIAQGTATEQIQACFAAHDRP